MIKTFLLLLLTAFMLPAEKYYVTFVKGDITLQSTGKKITVGTQLSETDQLVFSDKAAKLSCISPTKGRFDILADKAVTKKQNEWVVIVKDAIIPASATVKLSTRSLSGIETDPEKLFPTGKTILLIENEPVEINNKYSLSATNFFFIQYTSDGKTVVKKAPTNGQLIHFSADLFTGIATPLPEVSLCYQEQINGKNRSRVITKFTPVIIDKHSFLEQYVVLLAHLTTLKKTEQEKLYEIATHFHTNYGYIDQYLLEKAVH